MQLSRHCLSLLTTVGTSLLALACADSGSAPAAGSSASVGSGEVVAEPQDDAAYLYDQAQFHTFELVLAQADLDRLNSNPAAEMYVPGNLVFEGQTYTNVGVRYKGSVGAFQAPCTLGGSLTGGNGPKAGKCSIKVSFNWQDPQGSFFGLKKLLFHSMNNDSSFMRERLGYAMFREMGVPAPRATHARVIMNGAVEGVFALVEEIDGRFTRSRFTEGGKGNLYKEIWPIHDDAQAYLNALETNTTQNPSADRILRFKDAVLGGPTTMDPWLDRTVTAAYLAVDRVIMNDDGIFHFWCSKGGAGNNPTVPGNHNYFWYENEGFDRMWLIPWDLDYSFVDSNGGTFATSLVHVATDWTKPTAACGCSSGSTQSPPACDPVIMNWQTWLPDYNNQVEAFIAGPFSAANVEAKLAAWTAQIDAEVQATGGTNSAPTYSEWQVAVSHLRTVVNNARTHRGYPY